MNASQVTAAVIAEELSAVLAGSDRAVTGLAPLGEAAEGDLTFVVDPVAHADAAADAIRAGAILLAPDTLATEGIVGTAILVQNARAAFAQVVAAHFARRPVPGVAATARVDPGAQVHPGAHVGEYTVIRAGAVVAEGAEIRDHVVIGHDVRIGAHALIKSHAVIGEEGFGMERDADGDNIRIPHVGSVIIEDHVEVGNFTTVCSGTISPTRVGDHTKIDDHVHVAHNCRIGRNVIITACAEISGSVVIDDDAWIGPNASVIQGVTLGRNSLLGIGAVAVKSVPADEIRIGNPARRLGDNKR
ncbi:LpxD N-terminal domain-containing protein [Microbacterium sp. MYb66]|jgi:UDP-3-O-[3-hydroxymyristoyl] glucosamine N-acyltransferase|uniref:LpxD N-terminal domain-containing protein n=1 Tax=Microbacterium sp. MYb66 TaxID=1848692 RepID=UPI000D00AB88|nr:LpxD N-terminal domain-containing protein [Microbacterium sp. MYb66]PRA82982.1 transferase [Microbacterium sp. MYb66]